jgi:hypothetical protein
MTPRSSELKEFPFIVTFAIRTLQYLTENCLKKLLMRFYEGLGKVGYQEQLFLK